MDYTTLITSQHSSAAKFVALVDAITKPLAEITATLQSMQQIYDVDVAQGQQLDYVGQWVGVNRKVSTPIEDAWFSWNTVGLGWNEANWKGPYEPTEGIVDLDDSTYAAIIHNQIAANYWNGSVEEVQDLTFNGLSAFAIWVAVVDNMDMSVDVYVAGPLPAPLRALIQRNVIPPKTAGVRVNAIHEIDYPLFALDSATTIYFAGLDRGVFNT